ncbi:hypothetical protein [uncultured Paracoccus sp.]|uniref:hypothetical protein n=1 Tax=uncultured Paracoccus sp. TaxID=189685 RepID=UPI0026101EDD|nr:hypothetical protein [uncultured Paracoccus sp.]
MNLLLGYPSFPLGRVALMNVAMLHPPTQSFNQNRVVADGSVDGAHASINPPSG